MSMGCCVVTTTIGAEGLGNIVNGQEVTIEDKYDKMASTITRLLTNRPERQRMGLMAKNYVKNNFSFNKVLSIFEQIINE